MKTSQRLTCGSLKGRKMERMYNQLSAPAQNILMLNHRYSKSLRRTRKNAIVPKPVSSRRNPSVSALANLQCRDEIVSSRFNRTCRESPTSNPILLIGPPSEIDNKSFQKDTRIAIDTLREAGAGGPLGWGTL